MPKPIIQSGVTKSTLTYTNLSSEDGFYKTTAYLSRKKTKL